MRRLVAVLVVVGLAVLLLVLFARRAPNGSEAPLVPPQGTEARAFTERFIAFVHRSTPGARLEIVGDLAVRFEDGPTTDLANLWHECTTDPRVSDDAMARWQRVLTRKGAEPDARLENLRLALFPTQSLPPGLCVARSWLGPLSQVLVIDSPDSIATVTKAQASSLGTEDELFRRALDNLKAGIPEKIDSQPLDPEVPAVRIGQLANWGAARLLIPERWAGIAKNAHDRLLVAAPARDLVIWAADPTERELLGFRWLAQEMFAHEPHPISPAILRWQSGAWTFIDSNETPIKRP